MLARYHYHGLIKKYIAVFGTLFNNMQIKRQDNDGNFNQVLRVPVAYGPKPKFLTRITGDASLDAKVGMSMPRIGFDMVGFTYDTLRKLNSHNKRYATHNGNIGTIQAPVPYDINFGLYVFCKYAEDGTQIIEQILPSFKPELAVTINAISTMGIKLDVPVILNSVSMEDSYDGDFNTRRAIVWTLDFTMKATIWPNIHGIGFGDGYDEGTTELIRTSIVNFHIVTQEEKSVERSDKILLEDSTEFTDNFLTQEDGDAFLFESSVAGTSATDLVKSYIKREVSESISPDSTDYEVVDTHVFFNIGQEYDPASGNYSAP